MKLNWLIIIFVLGFFSCTSRKKLFGGYGDTRTQPVVLLDENTFKITSPSKDNTYGYSEKNPIKVGGVLNQQGPLNERRFINGLLGPEGQDLHFYRFGSCCSFKTPNAVFNNIGSLDKYQVYWSGCQDTLTLFINMYDEGDLFIPVGLRSRAVQ